MNENNLKYSPLPHYTSKEQIERVLEGDDVEELIRLPLAIGSSYHDWKYAQDTLIKLSEYEDTRISSNACLGLAYVARNHLKLEKHLIKPVLIKELRKNHKYNWRVIDSIEDINRFMNWNIAIKHLQNK